MNHCNLQQNACMPYDGRRGVISFCDQKDPVVCPKPRRVGILANNPIGPFRLQMSQTAELCEMKAGAELLDLILMKEGFGTGPSVTTVASSSPFFCGSPPTRAANPLVQDAPFYCGSPPTRAANPLVQDARFGDEKLTPVSTLPIPSPAGLPSPSSSAYKGGCVRMKFGLKPAAVRVEGFDCLNRDRQSSSIPAMA